MKKLFLFIAFFAICAVSMSAQDKWTGISRYDSINKVLLQEKNNGKRVVLMGNSITDYWVSKHAEFFKAHPNIIGRGISAQTSYQMLVRFREDVINLQPKVVVINAGINDIAENRAIPYNEDYTFGNIVSMTELAKANHINVVLTSLLPTKGIYWNKKITDVPAKIQSLNKRISSYAKKHGITYIDYYSSMVNKDDYSLKTQYTNDSLHPNVEGYCVMEPLLLKALKKFGL